MRRITLWIIFALACTAVIAGTIVLMKQKDRTAPQISYPEGSFVYTEGDETDALLEGVTATDERDGDLSAQVFIYEILPIEARGTAEVVYAVCDAAGNVGMAQRSVTYERRHIEVSYSGGGEPMIRLKSYGVTLEKGALFDPHDYVAELKDDKDSAEELKKNIGCVMQRPDMGVEEVKGRNLANGLPKTVRISSRSCTSGQTALKS